MNMVKVYTNIYSLRKNYVTFHDDRVRRDCAYCAPGEEGAEARIGLPSLASFLNPTDSTPVFRAIVDADPNFRAYHTCYAHTLAAIGGLDAAMEWDTSLWDVAATQILIEEAGGSFQWVKDTEVPGQGRFYSAVFGKPALVDRLAGIIEHTLGSAR